LRWETADDDEAQWAPVHAWRALGRLGAAEAAEPLLKVLRYVDDYGDDWTGEDLPLVYGQLGPGAVPALAGYLLQAEHGTWARTAASSGLEEIGKRHPDARGACVAALSAALEHYADQDEALNGSLAGSLVALQAVEAAPVLEQAFAAGKVDEMVIGDWEDVQIALGLKAEREHPRKVPPEMVQIREIADMLGQLSGRGRPAAAAPPAEPSEPEVRPVSPEIQSWNAAVEAREAAKQARREAGGKRKRRRR
jgi:hypothetical protein